VQSCNSCSGIAAALAAQLAKNYECGKNNQPAATAPTSQRYLGNGASIKVGTKVMPVACTVLVMVVSGFKFFKKQQPTGSNSARKPAKARQHGKMTTASLSWHNSSSVAAASFQPVMVS